MPTSVGAAIELARAALDRLRDRGESIEDEWQYVTDLHATWRGRFDGVAAARGEEALDGARAAAITAAIAEADSIVDPHRAIDWLSTYPGVVLLALGDVG
ncbi:MAG TPA: hypothetical protein VH723_07255 [Candidatus Limnocylindrales bacterium]|jgi:hypothetical protein